MARRHKRRHLAGRFTTKSIRGQDVSTGVIYGLLGGVAVAYGISTMQQRGVSLPSVLTGSPAVSALASGALVAGGVYVATGANRSRLGRTVGALGGGALAAMLVGADSIISSATPPAATAGYGFSPRALPAGLGAPLFNNPRLQGFNGPLFNNPNVNLARLSRMQGCGDDNDDGIFPAP